MQSKKKNLAIYLKTLKDTGFYISPKQYNPIVFEKYDIDDVLLSFNITLSNTTDFSLCDTLSRSTLAVGLDDFEEVMLVQDRNDKKTKKETELVHSRDDEMIYEVDAYERCNFKEILKRRLIRLKLDKVQKLPRGTKRRN